MSIKRSVDEPARRTNRRSFRYRVNGSRNIEMYFPSIRLGGVPRISAKPSGPRNTRTVYYTNKYLRSKRNASFDSQSKPQIDLRTTVTGARTRSDHRFVIAYKTIAVSVEGGVDELCQTIKKKKIVRKKNQQSHPLPPDLNNG